VSAIIYEVYLPPFDRMRFSALPYHKPLVVGMEWTIR
jgi:hypothetical protein